MPRSLHHRPVQAERTTQLAWLELKRRVGVDGRIPVHVDHGQHRTVVGHAGLPKHGWRDRHNDPTVAWGKQQAEEVHTRCHTGERLCCSCWYGVIGERDCAVLVGMACTRVAQNNNAGKEVGRMVGRQSSSLVAMHKKRPKLVCRVCYGLGG